MREILFRGKRIDNGEWAEGYYVKTVDYLNNSGVHLIIESPSAFYPRGEIAGEYEINPSTIGQFTGLTDRNGKKIFEGDIIKIVPDYDYSDDYSISKVYSYNGVFCVDYHGDDFDSTALGFLEDYLPDGDFEIIGNIHDNPELLEVKK